MFIQAERTGNWDEHLAATEKMLNLHAATGHFNYAKSTRLYLQTMIRLEYNFPWLHRQFKENRFYCVQRSDKYWAGLWTDLTIEQTMMRSIKGLGELTRGRGMNVAVQNLWIGTLHSSSEFGQAMRNVTLTKNQTSEEHVKLGTSRCNRDFEDLMVFYNWFEKFDPFDTSNSGLKSLATGLTAKDHSKTNCDNAESIGHILQEPIDKP